jgi:two-component system chemotaxis sensor kinase CheA
MGAVERVKELLGVADPDREQSLLDLADALDALARAAADAADSPLEAASAIAVVLRGVAASSLRRGREKGLTLVSGFVTGLDRKPPPPEDASSKAAAAARAVALAFAEARAEDEDEDAAAAAVVRDQDTKDIFAEFLDDASEGLAHVDQVLLDIEGGEPSKESLRAVLRAFHTIKGVAGFLDLAEIRVLAHTAETLLGNVETKNISLRGTVADLLFQATELMRRMLAAIKAAVDSDQPIASVPGLAALLQEIEIASVLHGLDFLGDAVGAARRMPTPAPARPELRPTLKVDLARMNALVDLVGELCAAHREVASAPPSAAPGAAAVRQPLDRLARIVDNLHAAAVGLWQAPARDLFQKTARAVRDVARKSDKPVRLEQSGEDLDIDRGVLKQLADPFMHLVRNAVDHGVESRDERRQAGKPEEAIIRLSARRDGDTVILEVADDGRGLDAAAILAKARQSGLIGADDALDGQATFDLIFRSGFSTAAKVTEISGRGVGMDIVKRHVEAMGGRVQVSSTPGRGTTFALIVPARHHDPGGT